MDSTSSSELKKILKFIVKKDQRILTAEKIGNEIRSKLVAYAENPDIGTQHAELPVGVLTCFHKRWVVIYQPIENGIKVHFNLNRVINQQAPRC